MTPNQIVDSTYDDLTEAVAHTAEQRRFIPGDKFSEVRKWSNTPTADFIPTRYGPKGFEFALARRKQKPWAGELFFLGGRILPGQIPSQGLLAVCKRELGFTPETGATKELLWQSIFNPEDEHGGESYFTMSCCWQVWVDYHQAFDLENNQSELCWLTLDETKGLSVYVQEAVNRLHRDPARDWSLDYHCG